MKRGLSLFRLDDERKGTNEQKEPATNGHMVTKSSPRGGEQEEEAGSQLVDRRKAKRLKMEPALRIEEEEKEPRGGGLAIVEEHVGSPEFLPFEDLVKEMAGEKREEEKAAEKVERKPERQEIAEESKENEAQRASTFQVEQLGDWTHTKKRKRAPPEDPVFRDGPASDEIPLGSRILANPRAKKRKERSDEEPGASSDGAQSTDVISNPAVTQSQKVTSSLRVGGEVEEVGQVIDLTHEITPRRSLGMTGRSRPPNRSLSSPPSSEKRRTQIQSDAEYAKSLERESLSSFDEELARQLEMEERSGRAWQSPEVRRGPYVIPPFPLAHFHPWQHHQHQQFLANHHENHHRHHWQAHGQLQVDTDSMTHEQILQLCERNGDVKRGVPKQVLKHLPRVQFKKSGNEEEGKCTICLVDFEEGETVNALPCLHKFHPVCIETWLKKNSACPICRARVE